MAIKRICYVMLCKINCNVTLFVLSFSGTMHGNFGRYKSLYTPLGTPRNGDDHPTYAPLGVYGTLYASIANRAQTQVATAPF